MCDLLEFFIQELLPILVIIIIVIGIVMIPGYYVSKYACLHQYSQFNPKFGMMTNCMISLDGGQTYIPSDNYRVTDTRIYGK